VATKRQQSGNMEETYFLFVAAGMAKWKQSGNKAATCFHFVATRMDLEIFLRGIASLDW
jgi:hypothetical protein